MKTRTTRRALVLSMLSLLLCVSMLVGTTFAWFTDSVTSGKNQIIAGNLDIELYYQNDETTDWTAVNENSNVFKENTLWEPGHTEVIKLKVVNAGTLALKYQLGVNVAGETGSINVDGKEFKLSDYIKFAVIEGDEIDSREEAVAAAEAANATALKDAYNSGILSLAAKNDGNTDEKIVTLVVYMPTSVGNEANYKTGEAVPTIQLGINLFATQVEAEKDSFGDDYDENAWNNGFKVTNAEELQDAINAGETEISVVADITTDHSIVIPDGADVTLNLNGNTITGTMHKSNGAVITNNGTLTVNGGTVSSTADNGGSALMNNGTATVKNATLNGAPNANGSWPSYAVNNTGVLTISDSKVTSVHGGLCSYTENAVITMNNTDLAMSGIPGFTSHGMYTYSGGKIVVNGGNIANNATDQNATGASVINGNVEVNSGNFSGRIENYYGTPVLKGGTYTVKPNAAFVADGYDVVDNGNGTYTVLFPQGSFDSLIGNAQPGDTVEVPAGTFVLSGNNDLKIVGSGENTVINIDGSVENVNISNATISGEPRLAVKTGQSATFNNVTFEGTKAWGSIHGAASFTGCTFEGLLHIDSSAETTTIKFTDCTFSETNIIKLGGYAKYILDGCTVETLAAGVEGAWGKEWLITYCDTTFNECELGRVIRAGSQVDIELNNCTDLAGKPVTAAVVHKNAAPTVWVNGVPAVFNNDTLKALVNDGQMNVMLMDGEYDLNGIQKDGLTLIGVGTDVKVANTTKYASGKAVGAIWKAINLENMTITNTVYTMADGGDATFKNVYFAAGVRQAYGKSVVFEGCTFGSNSEGYALHFQTDSASEGGNITLTGCEFEGGKVHLGGKRAYTFTGCEFAAGTDFQVWSNITLEGCTVDGEAVTADNAATLFPKLDLTKVTLK